MEPGVAHPRLTRDGDGVSLVCGPRQTTPRLRAHSLLIFSGGSKVHLPRDGSRHRTRSACDPSFTGFIIILTPTTSTVLSASSEAGLSHIMELARHVTMHSPV
jgi:hypothetical protein